MRLIIKEARVSFANSLFEGQMQSDGKLSYNCHLLLSKKSPVIKQVVDAMKQAANDKWGDKGPDMFKALTASGNVFLRNGDEKPDYDGYDGMMFLSVRTNKAFNVNANSPKLLNKDKTPAKQEQGTVYSGCYVFAILEVKGIDKTLKDGTRVKRISAYIQGLMVVKDGESLGGSVRANDEDFPDIADTGDDFGIGDTGEGSDELDSLING